MQVSGDLSEELDVLRGDGEAVTPTEARRWFHVLHVVRRLVEVLQQLLQQAGGKPLLRGRRSDSPLPGLLVPHRGILPGSRHFLSAIAIPARNSNFTIVH